MPPLDQFRQRIQDDLRGLVTGDVCGDDLFLHLYASDASIYEICPPTVVRPRSTADVAACVRYARQQRLPLIARGAGTGAAGGSLGEGLVLDFSTHLRRIIRSDPPLVRIQPGVVCERLRAHLRVHGWTFGPETSRAEATTMGGMVAVDASGSRWLRYGSIRDRLVGVQAVLADGEIFDFGREPLSGGESTSTIPRKREIINRLAALLGDNAELIRSRRLKSPIHRCGYTLDGVLGDGWLDVARLLSGSEGTLALFTEITLSADPPPGPRGALLLLFDGLEKAARAVPGILQYQPTACELMDRRHLTLARETEVRFDVLIPAETEALLLVELEDENPAQLLSRLRALAAEMGPENRQAFAVRQAVESDDVELHWELVRRIPPALHRLKGPARPQSALGDVVVPTEVLPEFLLRVQNLFKRLQVTATCFAHAGQGQIRWQPFLDPHLPEDRDRLRRLADELYTEVFDVGGALVGEHGYGLSRTEFLRRQAGPLYDVFREIKRIFDPENLLSPGKIISDAPSSFLENLAPPFWGMSPAISLSHRERAGVRAEAENNSGPHPNPLPEGEGKTGMRDLVELQLDWKPAPLAEVVVDCNRCGICRTQAPETRMCPIFRLAPCEEASPRAKANLLRGILSGAVDLEQLQNDTFKEIVDLCIHCHACRLECPAGVDIPRLMRDGKGAHVAAGGLRIAQWTMSRLDLVAAFASVISPVANWALGNRQIRWLLEKTLGIAHGRKLPTVAPRSFLRQAVRRRWNRPVRHGGPKVLYFVDLYANFFDPQLAEALVSVLEHNGVSVYVPDGQRAAGMPSIALGALDHARDLASQNIILLAEAVRQGYEILASEPAAALCLRREYPQLFDEDDARLVADHSHEACAYLWKLHTRGKLQLDFHPLQLTLAYHTPCHLRALQVGTPGKNLLGLIPGLRIHQLEEGCSGMAGTFGLMHKNYRSSLRAGRRLVGRLRDPAFQAGVTECSTCKLQMEQGAEKPTLHPLKLLALAYGLMPEVSHQIAESLDLRRKKTAH
ncbi:MAG: anaerobic glycerol-3-phosphate dehydrogenase subunit C [Pirellulales bacterium]|nr:anaerobic glycerol-3-phosphate dehydrogenase subunit C [Pirellulales bacterium]